MILAYQSGAGNIQDMLPVSCDENTKRTFTTVILKSDYFDKKTKNSPAPSAENCASTDFSSKKQQKRVPKVRLASP